MISLRSTSARILRTGRRLVDLELASSLAGTVIVRGGNSATGTFNVGPDDKITARSITFCSSRMLPGQLYWHKAFIVSDGMVSIVLFIRREDSSRNWPTTSGKASGTP